MGFGFYFVVYVQGVCNGTQGIEARCSEITSQQKKQRGCGARPKTLNTHPSDYFLQQGSTSKRSITVLNNSPTIIQIHEAVENRSHSNHNRQTAYTYKWNNQNHFKFITHSMKKTELSDVISSDFSMWS